MTVETAGTQGPGLLHAEPRVRGRGRGRAREGGVNNAQAQGKSKVERTGSQSRGRASCTNWVLTSGLQAAQQQYICQVQLVREWLQDALRGTYPPSANYDSGDSCNYDAVQEISNPPLCSPRAGWAAGKHASQPSTARRANRAGYEAVQPTAAITNNDQRQREPSQQRR